MPAGLREWLDVLIAYWGLPHFALIAWRPRRMTSSSLGGRPNSPGNWLKAAWVAEVCAVGEMSYHVPLLRDIYATFGYWGPGMAAWRTAEVFLPT